MSCFEGVTPLKYTKKIFRILILTTHEESWRTYQLKPRIENNKEVPVV